MGSDWQEAKLTDLYNISSGLSKPAKDFGTGYPFLAFKDIFNNFFVPDKLTQLVLSNEQEQEKCSVRRGDIFLTRTSETMHELGMSSVALKNYEKATFNGFTKRLRPNDKNTLVPEFVGYYLRSPQFRSEMLAFSTMSTRASLNNEMISRLKIRFPSVTEQKVIGRILKSLDDKIELNRRMNETLEAMAQTLFKSWFVDFDPVVDNALAAGNPIPEPLQARAQARAALGNQRKPLPPEIQQQFPNAFTFTEEIGWIPEGWEVKQIKEIAKIIKGKSYKSSELSESKTALVTLKSFNRGGGYKLDGLKEYTGSYKPEQEVFAGDLVIAYTDVTQAADVIGKPAMVVSDARYEHLVISLDVAVVKPKKNHHKCYLYGIAQTKAFQSHTHSHSTGTTVLHLGKNAVPDYYIAMPDDNLVMNYAKMADPNFTAIDKNISEIAILQNLRDTLLPKLLSGQIRIPEAEKLATDYNKQ